MTPKMISKTTKNIQITTRKSLSTIDGLLRGEAIKLVQEVMNNVKGHVTNTKCNGNTDKEVIQCLYRLVIARYEIADLIINVAEKWEKAMPNKFWFSVKYDDDDPERIDMYLQHGSNIAHVRFYLDILEAPLRLKFYVETAVHELSEPIDMDLIIKHLWMPLEPVETMELSL
jgi:hypothetical protein